jgi:hypothetical protein
MINFRSSAERRLRSWCNLLKNFADSPELPHSTSPAEMPLGRDGDLGWLFPFAKQLVHRNFESPRQLFEGLDARDGVAVLDAGDVTALQSGALLDITLRKVFLLPDGA